MSTAFTQSTVKIEGHVVDSESGQALVDANISVDGTAIGTTTNSQGYFVLEDLMTGEYTLEATYMGYALQTIRNVRVTPDRPTRVRFELDPVVLTVPAITIFARQMSSGESPSTSVITRQRIERSNALTVAQLLETVNGVSLRPAAGDGQSRELSIRGSQSNQVLVLLDGIRLNDEVTGRVDLSSISVQNVERIEVIKGAAAADYGEGALAGVVHIVSRTARANGIDAQVQVGSCQERHGSLSASLLMGDWSVLASAQITRQNNGYSYTYPHGGEEKEAERLNADVEHQSFFLRGGWQEQGRQMDLIARYQTAERGLPGQVYGVTPYARAFDESWRLRLRVRDHVSSWRWTASVFFKDDYSEYRNLYERFEVPVRYRSVPPYWNDNRLRHLGLTFKANPRWTPFVDLDVGGSVDAMRFVDRDRMPYLNDPVGEARTGRGALWLGTTWTWHPSRLLDMVKLNPRLRFDAARSLHLQSDTRRWDQQWSPILRLMLEKRVGLQWQMWVSTGRSFRLPTFADLFTEHYRVTGNSQLEPESARTQEAALAARWGGPVSGHLQATWFDNRVDNLIIWRMGNFATFSPVNTDARLQGMETELRLQWDSLNLTAAATRLNSTNLGQRSTVHGKQLPYRPEWTVTAGMGMALGPITLDYHLRAVDAQYVTEANTVQLPGYGVHDLSCGSSFDLFLIDGTVRLSVLNLTDASYQVIERSPLSGRQFQLRIQFNWPPGQSGR